MHAGPRKLCNALDFTTARIKAGQRLTTSSVGGRDEGALAATIGATPTKVHVQLPGLLWLLTAAKRARPPDPRARTLITDGLARPNLQ